VTNTQNIREELPIRAGRPYCAAVTDSDQRSLLFLDVDGPLIPFGAGVHPTYDTDAGGHPLLARVNPAHGPRLAALPCELIWATSWMDDANDVIAPLIGLPPLAVVTWPEPSKEDEWLGLHWKTRAIVDRAAGRPFVWVDDEITDTDRAWVSTHHRGHALLHRVDPRHGLTDGDYATLNEWFSRPRSS
jgi:HAD domain in Swiss Army Knife RNA repair proteins